MIFPDFFGKLVDISENIYIWFAWSKTADNEIPKKAT